MVVLHFVKLDKSQIGGGYIWLPTKTMSSGITPLFTTDTFSIQPKATPCTTVKKRCEALSQSRRSDFNDCNHQYIEGCVSPRLEISLEAPSPSVKRLTSLLPDGYHYVVAQEWSSGAQLWVPVSESRGKYLSCNWAIIYFTKRVKADAIGSSVTAGTWIRVGLYNYIHEPLSESGIQDYTYKVSERNNSYDVDYLFRTYDKVTESWDVWYEAYYNYAYSTESGTLVVSKYDSKDKKTKVSWPGKHLYLGDVVAVHYTRDYSFAESLVESPASYRRLLRKYFITFDRTEYQDLVVSMINDIAYLDLNMIAFVKDMTEVKQLIQSVAELLKAVKQKNINLKTISSAYLLKKYAIDTSINDVKVLLDTISRLCSSREFKYLNSPRKYHRRTSTRSEERIGELLPTFSENVSITTQNCVTGILTVAPSSNDNVAKFLTALDMFDANPTLENLWDLIPYSFVIDWFIDFGSNLEALAAYRKVEQMALIALIYSRKNIVDIEFNARSSLIGWLTYVDYQREVNRDWPGYAFHLNFSLPFHHIIEGGALLIQRA